MFGRADFGISQPCIFRIPDLPWLRQWFGMSPRGTLLLEKGLAHDLGWRSEAMKVATMATRLVP